MANKDHTNIKLSSVVRRSSEHLSVDIDGELALMDVTSGNYYGLSEVGSKIWQLIEEERRVSDVCNRLQQEFDVDSQQCEADVVAYLTDLARHDLIELKAA